MMRMLVLGSVALALSSGAAAQSPRVEVLGPPHPSQNALRRQRYDARVPRAGRPQRIQPGQGRSMDPTVAVAALPQPGPYGQAVPLPPPPPVDLREPDRGRAYVAFGFQSGLAMGLGAGLALEFRGGHHTAGGVVAGLGAPLLAATLALLLRRWARADHWREGPGQAMAGIYPGAVQGALFAGSIAHAFGLEGTGVGRTLGVSMGLTTLLSMVLHRSAGPVAGKRAALYYATVLLTAAVLSPFAVRFDRPEAMLYGATAAGAVHLVLTGLAPVIRW